MPVNPGALSTTLSNPTIQANMRLRQSAVLNAAKGIANDELVHHGRTRKDYHTAWVTPAVFRRGAFLVAQIGNDADHATFIERGTRPHVIRAKNAPLLVFDWPKAGMFPARFEKVNHPGNRAYKVLQRALKAAGKV